MLSVKNITKHFSKVKANENVNFHVNKGEVFGLLGPNGSGKTTLVSQVIGFLKPTSGRIAVAGVDVVRSPTEARLLCSLQPQDNISLSGLTPRQAIELAGRIRQGNKRSIKEKTKQLLRALQIEAWADKRAETLSGGIRRLVTFCMAIVVPGKLVILDEPTNDVDPVRRKLLWEQVRTLAKEGTTVLLITHNVLEAEKSVDRVALMKDGKIIGIGTPTSLKAPFQDTFHLELTVTARHVIQYPTFVTIVHKDKQKRRVTFSKMHSKMAMDWIHSLQEKALIEEFFIRPATLEDAYIQRIEQNERIRVGGN